jgi:hypothetical protein
MQDYYRLARETTQVQKKRGSKHDHMTMAMQRETVSVAALLVDGKVVGPGAIVGGIPMGGDAAGPATGLALTRAFSNAVRIQQ